MEYFSIIQGSLFKLTKDEYEFIIDLIREENPVPTAEKNKDEYSKEKFLDQVYITEAKYDRLVAVLTRKKNIILQGAPGVGKTYAAKRLAYSIMGEKDDDRIEFVQFHQNYSYEDFMMGYKPVEDGFELKYGIFYRFCQKAANHPDKDYFFIIDEMYNLLAAILSKGIGLQLKQGLYREYISHQEELTVMRGKINMPGTIKNKLLHKQVLTCDFDELSENNTLNQILKTTVMLLLRNGKVKAKYKDDLKKKMLYFSNVDSIEPTEIKWSLIRFQRNNQTYRMLVSICQLMIEGMLITTDVGNYRLASFVDEQRMCRLYEKFILEYYSRHYPELSVSASQIPWALDDGVGTMLPVMQTDIHLQRGNTVLIIDAKYYNHTTQVHFDKHTLHSNNLYQIFTYVKNRSYQFGEEDNTVSGMLLYAKTEEEIQPDNVYQMHGSQISVKTLDLNLPFVEIAAQMDRIVESHFTGVIKAD